MHFAGDVSIASWNTNALFACDVAKAEARQDIVKRLIMKYDIVCLQETRSTDASAKAFESQINASHRGFWMHSSQQQVGLAVIVSRRFLARNFPEEQHIEGSLFLNRTWHASVSAALLVLWMSAPCIIPRNLA